MTGLERNLKYWFTYIGKTMGLTYLMIIGICAVMSFFDGGNFLDTFSKYIVTYLIMASGMSIIAFGFTNITTIFPLTVSFGSRRSTSLIGMNVAQHVMCMLSFAFALLCGLYRSPEARAYVGILIPVVIGGVCLLFFMGNIVAFLSDRFGRTIGMILYVVFIMAVSVGAAIFVGGLSKGEGSIFRAIIDNATYLGFVICVVGILLDCLGIWLLAAGIKKKDLKF